MTTEVGAMSQAKIVDPSMFHVTGYLITVLNTYIVIAYTLDCIVLIFMHLFHADYSL